MTQFIDEAITVAVTRMQQIDNLDGIFTGDADFRSVITIDGKVFNGREFSGDNDLNPGTAWTFTNGASQFNGFVPIKIEIFEADPGDDTRVDINPVSGKKDLNLFLDLNTGRVLNDSLQFLGNINESITLRGSGDSDRGAITFQMNGVAGPEPENSVFIQNPFVQEAPENSDRLGGGFFNGNSRLVVGDFNDDGRDDLVVGSAHEAIAHVSYGSTTGLSKSGAQTFNSSNSGTSINGETFAVGDINGDGVDDLILGSSGSSPVIRFGKAGSGLNNGANVITKSSSFPMSVVFGSTLATGDFNGDGRDDVATGDPLADVGTGTISNDGAVQINYGSTAGITSAGLQVFHRDTIGISGTYEQFNTRFANALASGDINGDGFDDLVIGAPGSRDTAQAAGTFHILYGSSTGLRTTNNQLIGQSFAGVADQTGDEFGATIVVADVNGDRADDVIVGAPGRNNDAGQVYIYLGRRGQTLPSNAPQILTQSTLGGGSAEAGDRFGASIDAKDINNDGFADIVIGAPGEDSNTGSVHVVFGTSTGANGQLRLYKQGLSGVAGTRETGDQFGTAVTFGNFNGSGFAELAVSAPFEDFGNVTDAGLVNIIPTSSTSSFSLNSIESSKSGTAKSEVLQGTNANGIVRGFGGNDRLFTKGGDDLAMGGAGKDVINAGAGDDIIDGGKGRDQARGGKGQDIFVLAPKSEPDIIQDFRDSQDYLGLSKRLQFEDLKIIQRGENAVIRVGGDRLAILQGVQASQLTVDDFVQMGSTRFQGMVVPTVIG